MVREGALDPGPPPPEQPAPPEDQPAKPKESFRERALRRARELEQADVLTLEHIQRCKALMAQPQEPTDWQQQLIDRMVAQGVIVGMDLATEPDSMVAVTRTGGTFVVREIPRELWKLDP